MYSYIKGQIIDKNPAYCVIECNGVGYFLHISLNTYSKLTDTNCRVYTHLCIKSEATTPVGMTLYGFYDEEERALFRKLISVSGIGYNTALLMLSALNPDELIQAIITGNISLLQSVKGIGNKTAQRLVVELKDILEKHSSITSGIGFMSQQSSIKTQALTALVTLGFVKYNAEKVIDKILIKENNDINLEQLIKEALKLL